MKIVLSPLSRTSWSYLPYLLYEVVLNVYIFIMLFLFQFYDIIILTVANVKHSQEMWFLYIEYVLYKYMAQTNYIRCM